ncbi:DUF2510 domain-containing protein [Microbacterium sp. 22242]|uniref:DUF2510 domain-containing protein n=1 Tax=Microbacterium sp. 22242 TaxID=3453896 RepID=UPI003F82A8BC
MSAQPGWYDAGVPGRERWWDGGQWTAHERDVSPPAPTGGGFAGAAGAPVAAQSPLTAPAPGWYPAPGTAVLRWWEGRHWTGFRIKDGRPGTDGVTAEQPATAWVLGGLFLLVGVSQLLISFSTGYFGSGIPFIALGALWLVIAARTSALRRMPAPATAPVFPDFVRPLPGEQEGAGAGWYPVARTGSRWWTGTRWAEYVVTRFGIRPTFHGRRAILATRIMVWIFLGMGVLCALAGVLLTAGAADDSDMLFAGVTAIVLGILFVLLWIALLISSRTQARLLLVPATPPAAPAPHQG